MRLDSFEVRGFRSLAAVGPVRLKDLTVLVGPNDAGKSAMLAALAYLLEGGGLAEADRTLVGLGEDGAELPADVARVEETSVEAELTTSQYEQETLGLPAKVRIRRRSASGEKPVYEQLQTVSADGELRDLATASLAFLRELAQARGVEPDGRRTTKAAFLGPLEAHRDALPTLQEWTAIGSDVIRRLPRILPFSSTAQPDAEGQIRAALRAAYNRIIDQTTVKGSIEQLEGVVRAGLKSEADGLCAHVADRCPEVRAVEADPEVSFSGGFTGLVLRTVHDNGDRIELSRSGAGKQQRVTLAVWEWVSELIGGTADPAERETIVVYDEPDTHLDYQRQRAFLDLMRRQADQPGVQVVVATHSLNLLDRVDLSDVIGLRCVDHRTVVDAVTGDSAEAHEAFSASIVEALGLRNSTLLNERCFLVVEGDTDSRALPVLFRLHTGYSVQSAGIAVMACDSNEGALKVARFLVRHQRKVIFLIDADSRTKSGSKKWFAPAKLDSYEIPDECRLYVGDPHELEELFSDASWCVAANKHWPRADEVPWREEDIAALRGGKFSADLEQELRRKSMSGPSGKPDMLATLVGDLPPADVPQQLRDRFDQIVEIVKAMD
ncbi:ATP-dependent nuclease [Pimelobacter simplex]|uniref:AAA family ATPase n=1 Tax=Nocardioides simplex TaxID=2045 RepID=UPI003AAE728C